MPDFSDAVQIFNDAKKAVIRLTGHIQPAISVMDNDLEQRIILNGSNANIFMRAKKKAGQLLGDITFKVDGDVADLILGGGPANGDLMVVPVNLDSSPDNASFHYSAGSKVLLLKGANNQPSIRVDGAQANFWVGGNGMDGDIVVHPSTVDNNAKQDLSSIHLSGDGSMISIKSGGVETIRIDGAKGDIVLLNADGAEEFAVEEHAEPGTVLVIEQETRLRIARRPYDRRVAGVVSGADGIKPGIVLGRSNEGGRVPVALFGKVNCMVDAGYGAIAAGDLLTTSATPGHAMRAEPGGNSMGAVIGKAMRGLDSGRGMVPVLVALQ